jgi:Zn-finger nucleic acid-binding protein
MLSCPVCHVELEPFAVHGVTVHECPRCQGRWFEGKELRAAIDKTDDDLRWLDFQLFEEKDQKYARLAGDKACPSDSTKMLAVEYSHSKVQIDKCETCGGVWLSKTEFERIVKYLEDLVVSETADQYARDALRELKEIGEHPTHAVSELRDFFAVARLLRLRLLAEHPQLTETMDIINRSYPH